MKKIIQRLLIFVVGVPLVLGIVLLLPHYHHLVLNLVVTVFSVLGSVEFAAILGKKGFKLHPAEAVFLGILGPLAATMINSFALDAQIFPLVLILGAFWLLVSRVFSSGDKLLDHSARIVAGFSVMAYPGLLMVWIILMSAFPHAEQVILAFFLVVFGNDSLAWAAGMLFGKGNRGIIPASPNKSLAGFITGIGVSVLVGVLAELLLKDAFVTQLPVPALAGIAIGLCTGIAATLGDLTESAMKRSSGMKDSGAIIPGRGGVLDSIDSLALAAPVFYILYRLLF
jgi:phosphatidate cytidylyltransferase